MPKSISIILIALIVLSGCNVATKEEPHSEHVWLEATCELPIRCEICGETIDEPLGHIYGLATLDSPKTCTRCGETTGAPLILNTYALDENLVGYKLSADKRFIYASWGDMNLELNIQDENGEFIYDNSWSYTAPATLSHGSNEDVALVLIGLEEAWKVSILDWDGNEICTTSLAPYLEAYYRKDFENYETRDWEDLWLRAYIYEDFPLIRIVRSGDKRRICYIDYTTGEVIKDLPEDMTLPEQKDSKVLEGWYYAQEEPAVNGYFVGGRKGTRWGYLNSGFEEIAMYQDATSFIGDYALVSEDGISYDLIGSDLSIISSAVIHTDGSGISVRNDSLAKAFVYTDDEGNLNLIELIKD